MRSIYCMTAAIVLAAGVSARADVVGMINVSAGFTNSMKASDLVVPDTANGAGEFAGAFYLSVDAIRQGNSNLSLGSLCFIADVCGDGAGTNDGSAVPLQAAVATRSGEPSSMALLGTGLLGFAAVMRRRFVG